MKYVVAQVSNWDGTINAPKQKSGQPQPWPSDKGATLVARAENGDEVSFRFGESTHVDHRVGDEIDVTLE